MMTIGNMHILNTFSHFLFQVVQIKFPIYFSLSDKINISRIIVNGVRFSSFEQVMTNMEICIS